MKLDFHPTALCSFGKEAYYSGGSLGLWGWKTRDPSGLVGEHCCSKQH